MRYYYRFLFLLLGSSNSSLSTNSTNAFNSSNSRVPGLQSIVLEAHPWVILDQRCTVNCNNRIQAIGVLGLLLFRNINLSIRALIDDLDYAVSKENLHFNALMAQPLVEISPSTHSVYEELTVRRSGKVKSLLYRLLAQSRLSSALGLAIKIALMRDVGRKAQQAVMQGRPSRRQLHRATTEYISQVLLVPELESFIGSTFIKHFLQVPELSSFEYLCSQFAHVSDAVSKLLLENVKPPLTKVHLRFMKKLPFLTPSKRQMLKNYGPKEVEKLSKSFILMEKEHDQQKLLWDSILVNESSRIILKPIYVSSPISSENLVHVHIYEDTVLKLEFTRNASLLHHSTQHRQFTLLKAIVDPEIKLQKYDLIITGMTSSKFNSLVLKILPQLFQEHGPDDPLFFYFVRKYSLSVFSIDIQ